MEVAGILISLILLMVFAYRGYSVIILSPIFALLCAFIAGLPLMPAYTELFMTKAVIYVKSFFPAFLLGAVFGKIMEETGMARSIAHTIIGKLGRGRAILAVVISGAVLTYGGVSLFVVVFAIYPLAASLFREANIPKRLIPGTIALGAFTFTMDAMPGTPQIQNIIPTSYFGTNIYAAPWLGLIGSVGILILGLSYLEWCRKNAAARGEGYGDHTQNEPDSIENAAPVKFIVAILPLLTVLVLNFFFVNIFQWQTALLEPFKALHLPLLVPGIANVVSIWSLTIALVCGIILSIGMGYTNLTSYAFKKAKLTKTMELGIVGSLVAIMNTASVVGYGNVVASLDGFKSISSALMGIKIGGTPLMSEAISITTLAGITGSASGGLSIALDLMGKYWLQWSQTIGMSPEVLHRVAAMASGGIDTLPHNGAVITLLLVCGLTHRDSYKDILAMTAVKTIMVFVVIAIYSFTGIV